MYSPRLIAEHEARLLGHADVRARFPHGFPTFTESDLSALVALIVATQDPDTGATLRPLTPQEADLVYYLRLRVGYDTPFYLRFVQIDEEGHGIRPLLPLWESQRFVLDRLGAMEEQSVRNQSPDGLLLNILKCRQVGVSTLGMALVSHRILTQRFIRAIAGSDTEEQARYLFRMVERIYAHLPWFLRSEKVVPYAAGRELHFANQSSLKTAWGKTTRGALQDVGGKKGNIERGRTNSVVHISELATWDNPEQLDSALLPGIPISSLSLVLFESTAELAGDWWHRHFLAAQDGEGRFRNIFIPWCVEPRKYSLPPPALWAPSDETLKVAAAVERDSAQWVGETLRPNRAQLYWYETTRAYYAKKNQLHDFLKEFPSNPEECVAGDTRICTERGLIPIAEAQTDVRRVESGVVTNWWDRGTRAVLRLTTTYGRELVGTPEHLVALADGSWRALADLTPGTEIALAPIVFAEQPYTAMWAPTPVSKTRVLVTEDLARLLGFYLGDGSWNGAGMDIACFAGDGDVVCEVVRLIEQTIGRTPCLARAGKGGLNVRSSDRRWKELCWALGLVDRRAHSANPAWHGGYKKRLAVPECIWRSPQPVVAAFLSGLFESDGHANRGGPQVSLFSKSEALIREIQLLLLGFGINAPFQTAVKHHRGKTYTGRYLRLNAENAVRFHERIGFIGARKRSAPHQIGGRGKGWGRRAQPIATTDTVKCVESAGERSVYDLGVAETHRFGANGLLVHNCFQYAGRSVYTFDELQRIDQSARKVIDVWAVEPSREIADLRRLADTGDDTADAKALALREDRRPPAPVAPRPLQRDLDAFPVPAGFGFRRLLGQELADLISPRHSVLTIYEYPRVRGPRRYIVGVDVGDGLGQDYSVVSVIRLPTLDEVAEEVAQYVSNKLRPSLLAFVVDAIGRLYTDDNGVEACAAIEINNHGIAVQEILQLHLGYTNFYVWEVVDAADPSARYTKRIGWQTTTRTRPILLEKFHDATTTIDPISGLADFRLNSAVTRSELRHFVTEGLLGEAEHARGQHDDAIFASAIGYLVAYKYAGGETEPIAERRRRRAHLRRLAAETGVRRDYRNSPVTVEEADDARDPDEARITDIDGDDLPLHFDDAYPTGRGGL